MSPADGGLEYIKQYPSGSLPIGGQSCAAMLASIQAQQIGVGRLIAYVNDQEAGNWLGVSYIGALPVLAAQGPTPPRGCHQRRAQRREYLAGLARLNGPLCE
jgi:hypothetical protein